MAALTPISRKPLSLVLPAIAAAGGFLGLFVGTSNGSGSLGIVIGAALVTLMGFVFITVLKNERLAKWISILGLALLGFLFAGIPTLILGAIAGWLFHWFTYWLYEGRYRARLLPYLTARQVLWHYGFRVICGAIFVFLITPILVVMPLSFNAQDFFTFTPEMLRFDPEGYSLKHYRDFFTNNEWQRSFKNSLLIAPIATVISVSLGTLAAIGLSQSQSRGHAPGRQQRAG